MGWRKALKRYKEKIMIVGAIALVILMIGETLVMIGRGGVGGAITVEELKKYEYIPPEGNYTIMVFIAPPQTCPICPELVQNITQAVKLVNEVLAQSNTSIRAHVKIFDCANFPHCTSKEAYVNFMINKVSQVPMVFVSYRGFKVPINVVGMSPQQMAQLLLAWLKLMSAAWKPPAKGVAVVYFYDSTHNSTQWQELVKLLKPYNITLVELGCKQYPSNCTNNVVAYATMLVLGLRPENLPMVLIYKDGQLVGYFYLGKQINVVQVAKEIESLLKQ
ncbi:hypothetical protein IPA_03680 [Ignicoccus pacificus DSM 13166]|uniref:Thioredoxin-like fold domain-containing protein n=1 Tax=Ignicoccus pacificus DSM 13166 TaxID=940294 RepID=A0A977KB41_9CREN|nr:hypothetical protein IPA_03680 [Ignicoccus pacificus DSM 13166]